jgi:hypothetical protein
LEHRAIPFREMFAATYYSVITLPRQLFLRRRKPQPDQKFFLLLMPPPAEASVLPSGENATEPS